MYEQFENHAAQVDAARANLIQFLTNPVAAGALAEVAALVENGDFEVAGILLVQIRDQFEGAVNVIAATMAVEEAREEIRLQRNEAEVLRKTEGNLDEALESLLDEAEEYANAPWDRYEDPWGDEGVTRGRE